MFDLSWKRWGRKTLLIVRWPNCLLDLKISLLLNLFVTCDLIKIILKNDCLQNYFNKSTQYINVDIEKYMCLLCIEVYRNRVPGRCRSRWLKATGDRRSRGRTLVASEKYIRNYITSFYSFIPSVFMLLFLGTNKAGIL